LLFSTTTNGAPRAGQLLFSATTNGAHRAGQLLFPVPLMVSWSWPIVIACSIHGVLGAGQLLFPVPLTVFLEQASCYSLLHSWCSWIRPAASCYSLFHSWFSCSTHSVPGADQLLFTVPLIVFLDQASCYSLFHS
jgi:hypothetical protein